MQDMIAREVQRKQAIYDGLSRQLDKIVPRLIAKADRLSAKGRPINVTISIWPYFSLINVDPLKNNCFAVGVDEAKYSTQQWIIDEADRRFDEASCPLRASFHSTFSTYGLFSPNQVGATLPNPTPHGLTASCMLMTRNLIVGHLLSKQK